MLNVVTTIFPYRGGELVPLPGALSINLMLYELECEPEFYKILNIFILWHWSAIFLKIGASFAILSAGI